MSYFRTYCPECDSTDTKRVHVEWLSDAVEEVRICNDCPTQYTNHLGISHKEVDEL